MEEEIIGKIEEISTAENNEETKHSSKSVLWIILGSATAALLSIIATIVIIIYAINGSPGNVAKQYAEAEIFDDRYKMDKYCAYDYCDSWGSPPGLHTSWKSYSTRKRDHIDDELFNLYGDYTIKIKVIRSENASTETIENHFPAYFSDPDLFGWNPDRITAAKKITLNGTLIGDEGIESDRVTLYLVRIGFTWKVLDGDAFSF